MKLQDYKDAISAFEFFYGRKPNTVREFAHYVNSFKDL